jgi:hypothetical protein
MRKKKMLTISNSRGFNGSSFYPIYEYHEINGNKKQGHLDGSKIIPIPEGYKEVIRYNTEQDHFAEYLKDIEDEHKHYSDEKMLENPTGIYRGRGRNSRWMDEINRRGIK